MERPSAVQSDTAMEGPLEGSGLDLIEPRFGTLSVPSGGPP